MLSNNQQAARSLDCCQGRRIAPAAPYFFPRNDTDKTLDSKKTLTLRFYLA